MIPPPPTCDFSHIFETGEHEIKRAAADVGAGTEIWMFVGGYGVAKSSTPRLAT